jgi:hypothetical protein
VQVGVMGWISASRAIFSLNRQTAGACEPPL